MDERCRPIRYLPQEDRASCRSASAVLGECFRPVMIFFSTPRRSARSVAGGDQLQI